MDATSYCLWGRPELRLWHCRGRRERTELSVVPLSRTSDTILPEANRNLPNDSSYLTFVTAIALSPRPCERGRIVRDVTTTEGLSMASWNMRSHGTSVGRWGNLGVKSFPTAST